MRDSLEVGQRNPSPAKPSLLFCLIRKGQHPISTPSPVQSDYQAKFADGLGESPAGVTSPGLWKRQLRSVFGKKTWAKLVLSKQMIKKILRPGLDSSHYRAVACWPPEERFEAKRAEFPPPQ